MKLNFARFRMVAEEAKRRGVLQESVSAPVPLSVWAEPDTMPLKCKCGADLEGGNECEKCRK